MKEDNKVSCALCNKSIDLDDPNRTDTHHVGGKRYCSYICWVYTLYPDVKLFLEARKRGEV